MLMRKIPLLISAMLTLATACGGTGESPPVIGQQSAAITEDRPEQGHPAVGMLDVVVQGGESRMCSASLIGPTAVLTAAHCVERAVAVTFRLPPLGQSQVTSQTPSYAVDVSSIAIHPGFFASETRVGNDLAVLHLRRSPPVQPVALARQPPLEGASATLVGYGLTASGSNDSGIKRAVIRSVSTVTPTIVGFPGGNSGESGFCLGDSGGPSFAVINGVVSQIGVHSYLFNQPHDDPCQNEAYSMRVDTYADWILKMAAEETGTTPRMLSGIKAPPEVSIASPHNGSSVPALLVVRADVQDDRAVGSAQLLLDGKDMGQIEKPPFEFVVGVPLGDHRLQVVVWDVTGNRGEAEVSVVGTGEMPEMGCHVGGSTSEPPWLPSVLAVFCWVIRRRRRQRR